MSQLAALLQAKLSQPEAAEVCPITAGDTIEYSSAAGRLTATVNKVEVGPTAKLGHNIPWLSITIHRGSGRRFASNVCLPGDSYSLAMYKVSKV